jgi:hypothetical protein
MRVEPPVQVGRSLGDSMKLARMLGIGKCMHFGSPTDTNGKIRS